MSTTILAFDLANVAHRAYHRLKHLTTGRGRPSGHVFGSFKIIASTIKKHTDKHGNPPTCWYALDGYPAQRMRLFPEYKGSRDRDYDPVTDVVNMCRVMPGMCWGHPQLEADDVLAMLTHPRFREDRKLVISSGDHDLWQLMRFNGVWVWCRDHFVDATHITAEFGLDSPKAIPLYKALFGDDSDDIPPVVANVRRQPWVNFINANRLTTPTAMSEVFASDETKQVPSNWEKIVGAWPLVRRNWKLVKLRRAPVKPTLLVSSTGPANGAQLVRFLQRFECKSLYNQAAELWR